MTIGRRERWRSDDSGGGGGRRERSVGAGGVEEMKVTEEAIGPFAGGAGDGTAMAVELLEPSKRRGWGDSRSWEANAEMSESERLHCWTVFSLNPSLGFFSVFNSGRAREKYLRKCRTQGYLL